MSENVRHHFIPQCYLSNFSNNGKAIWVYNKKERKSYLTSKDKIFQEKNFYRIPDELIPEKDKDKINPLSIEKDFFAKDIESQFSHYLKSIVALIDEQLIEDPNLQNFKYELNEDYIEEFAMQIAIQYFRTPKERQEVGKFIDGLSRKVKMADSRCISKTILSELNKPYIHNPIIAHFWTIFANNKFIPKFKEILKNKIWLTCISPNVPFYTSDSPIIVDDPLNMFDGSDISLNATGGIITYPLTSKILFKLFDREYYTKYYSDLAHADRSIIIVDEEYVKKENTKQFNNAQNEIVSPIDNFGDNIHHTIWD